MNYVRCRPWLGVLAAVLLAAVSGCITTPEPASLALTDDPQFTNPLSGTHQALAAYDFDSGPPPDPAAVSGAMVEGIGAWLTEGHDASELQALLRTLPRFEEARVRRLDLDGHGLDDVVISSDLLGLPVVAFLAGDAGSFSGYVLPPAWDEPFVPASFQELQRHDLTGDGRPETFVSYHVQAASGWQERLYVYRWQDGVPVLTFYAELSNWAGYAAWAVAPDPEGAGVQIILTYPRLYEGFDHKMTSQPLGRQTWRWDGVAGRCVKVAEEVDLESGPEGALSRSGRLKALVNAGEEAFRAGEYGVALRHYERALALVDAEGWKQAEPEPDWHGVARFRRAEALALAAGGRSDEVAAEMGVLAEAYAEDVLGQLAAAFLSGYEGETPAARAVAAMQAVNLYEHAYYERGGVLAFPVDAGLLYPPAGISAYLDAHPEAATDPALLEAELVALGYDVARVEQVGGESSVAVTLRLPVGEPTNGAGKRWRFAPSPAGWRVVPADTEERMWPVVGGPAPPRYEGEWVAPTQR